ncbi:methyl-accepting chemotaxis protein [Evansella caseinilytica]|uniref:Methyl-accepting chemotaxis protein n=1 Tax=Evansella caseinilytica TaxID=1503961 RepID=A0A1H3GEG1_9BACI|nr:methyl-accepting chemotaxis protein [Evansella caseinilytica]SDY01425.1 methyl-accepting chemotaxis protein [Evansella caseinilytica]
MIKNLKIVQKLIFVGIVSIVLLLSVSLLAFNYMNRMAANSETMYEENLLVVQTVGNIRVDIRAIDSFILEYMITLDQTRNEELSQMIDERVEQARNNAQTLNEISQNNKGLNEESVELGQRLETYLAGVLEVGELASRNENTLAYELYLSEVANKRAVLVEYGLDMMKRHSDAAAELNRSNHNEASQARIVTISIVVAAVIVSVLLSIIVSRSIIKPVRQLQGVMEEAEAGNLTVRGTYQARDEIGQLTGSFNSMLQSIQEVIQRIVASGDEVAAASEELNANAQETLKGTESVAGTMEEIAAGTEKQLQEVSETAAVITELSDGVKHVTNNTKQVSEVVSLTSEKAGDGKQAIGQTVGQMKSIQSTFDVLSVTIQGLGERSNEIGEIISSITAIADQTNLLALNAAIEAARAGEHGRGFAVVADEVRKLAEESSTSAMQISSLIEKIQLETKQAVDSMESTSKEVKHGIDVVNIAGETFEEIDTSINEVNGKMALVGNAVHDMEMGMQKIVAAFTLIKGVTETVTAGTQNVSATTEEQLASMEEITSSADSLATIAEELQEMVSRFKA